MRAVSSIALCVYHAPKERANLLKELRKNAHEAMKDVEKSALKIITDAYKEEALECDDDGNWPPLNDRVRARIKDEQETIFAEAQAFEELFRDISNSNQLS